MNTGEFRLDRDTFLARHWQREPLLIRNGIPGFTPPLAADELAGLALEDGVEARIIANVAGQWQQRHGPFTDADFQRDGPWTLLVQAVDHYVPEVAQLRKLVNFLPQWRVDDVMVSYAVDGGSVGPHYDNYDVFLIQGEGERLWRLGQSCDADTAILPHPELRILEHFECQHEYVLGPGDALYVPPGVAHWGIARGECTTFSLGFRAPRIYELVSRWADSLLEQLDPAQFYSDAGCKAVSRAGEIRPGDLARARSQLRTALAREPANHWFGELVTEPHYAPATDTDQLAAGRALLGGRPARILLCPAAKIAWQQQGDGILVFANGQGRVFGEPVLPLLIALCESWRVEGTILQQGLADAQTGALANYLLEQGCIDVE